MHLRVADDVVAAGQGHGIAGCGEVDAVPIGRTMNVADVEASQCVAHTARHGHAAADSELVQGDVGAAHHLHRMHALERLGHGVMPHDPHPADQDAAGVPD